MIWSQKRSFFFSISKLKLSRFRIENFEKLTLCIACAHSLASQCMEGHWMWDYQMCEAEILQGSGKGHTHAYSHQLVPKNSNFRPRIFLVCTCTVDFQWCPIWKTSQKLSRPLGVFPGSLLLRHQWQSTVYILSSTCS